MIAASVQQVWGFVPTIYFCRCTCPSQMLFEEDMSDKGWVVFLFSTLQSNDGEQRRRDGSGAEQEESAPLETSGDESSHKRQRKNCDESGDGGAVVDGDRHDDEFLSTSDEVFESRTVNCEKVAECVSSSDCESVESEEGSSTGDAQYTPFQCGVAASSRRRTAGLCADV